ncbi:MAG: MrpF/PhaF family protein, partial [Rickettsiales bacterium]|nr:MrpF/PhaF family protein [Rickettsiales bacterium]
ANTFGTKTMVLIALMGLIMDEMMFLDIALVYALINFVTTIGFLKFFKHRSFARED